MRKAGSSLLSVPTREPSPFPHSSQWGRKARPAGSLPWEGKRKQNACRTFGIFRELPERLVPLSADWAAGEEPAHLSYREPGGGAGGSGQHHGASRRRWQPAQLVPTTAQLAVGRMCLAGE